MPLGWHRNTGPRDPGMTQATERTLGRLDALVDRLNEGIDRFEAVLPKGEQGRREGQDR